VPLKQCLDSCQSIIDLNHLARECFKTRLEAAKSVLEAVESCVHICFETVDART